jgi:peroxiredoxin
MPLHIHMHTTVIHPGHIAEMLVLHAVAMVGRGKGGHAVCKHLHAYAIIALWRVSRKGLIKKRKSCLVPNAALPDSPRFGGKIMKEKNVIIGILSVMILFVIVIEMFYLIRQNHTLKKEIQRMQQIQRIEHIEIGSQAPDFELSTIEGRRIDLSDYSGRNIILIFFSTDCPGCVMDIPNWKRLLSFRDDSLDVLGISKSTLEKTQEFLSYYALDFEVAIDENELINEIYKCHETPQKVLIGKNGKVEMVEAMMVQIGKTGVLERKLRGPFR